MIVMDEIKKSCVATLWFIFLTFPIAVIKIDSINNTVKWRWLNMVYIGVGSFFLSMLWRYMIKKKEMGGQKEKKKKEAGFFYKISQNRKIFIPLCVLLGVFTILFPHIFSMYQTTIMISALIYVMLGLGLNIVVGLAGLLDLGYVAFFALGAYLYALLNMHYGVSFWVALPLGGMLAALFGLVLGYPVLKLRGDYLAIVTLGFGEIIRIISQNWDAVTFGPSGIANIPPPPFFGVKLSLQATSTYIFYIIVVLVIFTIFIINRLKDSRIGRAWVALKDDEIACQSMGIDKGKTKLTAFALGATWAGMAGVVFAAKTTFINPASFTIWESIIILCIVVLGGMGSIAGVISGAFLLILLPEYLRAFAQYRMLAFASVLILMMIFRPNGMIENVRKIYKFKQ